MTECWASVPSSGRDPRRPSSQLPVAGRPLPPPLTARPSGHRERRKRREGEGLAGPVQGGLSLTNMWPSNMSLGGTPDTVGPTSPIFPLSNSLRNSIGSP